MNIEWIMVFLAFLGLIQTIFMGIIGYIFQRFKEVNENISKASDTHARVTKEIYYRIEDLMKELHKTQVEMYQYYALKVDLEKHEQEGRDRVARLHDRIDRINAQGCVRHAKESSQNAKPCPF